MRKASRLNRRACPGFIRRTGGAWGRWEWPQRSSFDATFVWFGQATVFFAVLTYMAVNGGNFIRSTCDSSTRVPLVLISLVTAVGVLPRLPHHI